MNTRNHVEKPEVKEPMPNNHAPMTYDEVEIVAQTQAAILCNVADDEVWIPRSQILEDSCFFDPNTDVGDCGSLVIPEWLAIEKGLE